MIQIRLFKANFKVVYLGRYQKKDSSLHLQWPFVIVMILFLSLTNSFLIYIFIKN